MTIEVSLSGFDELADALGNAQELFIPLASKAMAISLEAIYEKISPYPPQPDRMRSGHLNTYVRGVGNYPASAFVQNKKEPGGFATKKVKVGQIRMTSQQMSKRFKESVSVNSDELEGELSNEASYWPYVIGPVQGDPHQVEFHEKTGWINSDQAVIDATPQIEKAIDEAINIFLNRLTDV
jgi:hypothetical protein